jgi:hypothetical protein
MVRTFELVDHPFQKCESTIHKVGSAIKSKMTPSVKYGSTFIAYIYISLSEIWSNQCKIADHPIQICPNYG